MNRFSNDIGIDLGTANTLVYLKGQGVVIDEPSIVAINTKTGRVVAVGRDAKKMQGRTPKHIEVVRPLYEGVVSDFEVTEEMLHYFITKAEKISTKKVKVSPRVVVGVPSGITNVEARAVVDAAKNAGAREVYIVEEPMAAAIGIGLPVNDPMGSMIIDIGGGTTDIGVISLGGIVQSKNLKIAGDVFTQDIISYLRSEFRLLVGESTSEKIKIRLSSVTPGDAREVTIKGRDVMSGLPREIVVTDSDVRQAILPSVLQIVDGAREVIEMTPPELLSDVMRQGIYLVGGGALISGLDELLQTELSVPILVADEPLQAVVNGTEIILSSLEEYINVLTREDNDLPSR